MSSKKNKVEKPKSVNELKIERKKLESDLERALEQRIKRLKVLIQN